MTKKNRNISVGFGVILAFLFLTFFANFKSGLYRKLLGPIEGTDGILTFGSNLSVVSKNNNIYTWQWDNLKKWPTVAKPKAEVIIPINNDRLVYAANSKLILTDLKAEKELASLTLPYDTDPKKLVISSNGQFGLISLAQKDKIKIALFNSEFKDLPVVFEKSTGEEKITLFDYAVNNEGTLIAGAGKKDKAWIFVKDVKNDKILWEKTFEEYGQFTIVKFSLDGKTIYAAEKVRFIVCLDANAGNILRTYEIPEYQTSAHQKQNIGSLAISPDGKILAANTEPACTIWYWDIATGQKINSFRAHDFTVSDIAFSSDSKYIASGCLVKPEIKIWKVPQPK
jgi:WD40 repeat protein